MMTGEKSDQRIIPEMFQTLVCPGWRKCRKHLLYIKVSDSYTGYSGRNCGRECLKGDFHFLTKTAPAVRKLKYDFEIQWCAFATYNRETEWFHIMPQRIFGGFFQKSRFCICIKEIVLKFAVDSESIESCNRWFNKGKMIKYFTNQELFIKSFISIILKASIQHLFYNTFFIILISWIQQRSLHFAWSVSYYKSLLKKRTAFLWKSLFKCKSVW